MLTLDLGARAVSPQTVKPFWLLGPSVAINHLLKHAIEAVGTALGGVGVAETAKSVAVIEAAERVLPWQTRIPGRVVDEVIDLHHRERAPVALLEGEVEPALTAPGGSSGWC